MPPAQRPSIISISKLSALILAIVAAPALSKERAANQVTRDCSIAKQPGLWRDAGPEDYAGKNWKAWMAATGEKSPWIATGDFDGDGKSDVAKIVIRKSDGKWMMGVVYGGNNAERCRTYQIASNTFKDSTTTLAGLVSLKRGEPNRICHHIGIQKLFRCAQPNSTEYEAGTGDTILIFDDVPTYISAYAFAADGAGEYSSSPAEVLLPKRYFKRFTITVAPDQASSQQSSMAESKQTRPGDKVSPKERQVLVEEFNSAWLELDRQPRWRAVTTVVTKTGSVQTGIRSTHEWIGSEQLRTVTEYPGSPVVEMIRIRNEVWTRHGQGSWTGPTVEKHEPSSTDSPVGNGTIISARPETQHGRKVKVLELNADFAGEPMRTTLTLDVHRKLPISRIDRFGERQINTTIYEHNAKFEITAPVARATAHK